MEADSTSGTPETIPAGKPPRPSAREGSASLRDRLTPQYLQGEWCGVYSQERMWYVFADDGSYQAGMGHLPDVEGTIDALVEDFRVIIEVEADRFVLARGKRQSYRLVMSRGACRAASAPAEERAPRAPGSR